MVLEVLSDKVLDGVKREVIHAHGSSSLAYMVDVAQVHSTWSRGHGGKERQTKGEGAVQVRLNRNGASGMQVSVKS